jgi:hypothetical protein
MVLLLRYIQEVEFIGFICWRDQDGRTLSGSLQHGIVLNIWVMDTPQRKRRVRILPGTWILPTICGRSLSNKAITGAFQVMPAEYFRDYKSQCSGGVFGLVHGYLHISCVHLGKAFGVVISFVPVESVWIT